MDKPVSPFISRVRHYCKWLVAGSALVTGMALVNAQASTVSAADITPSATTATSDGKLATAFSKATLTSPGQQETWTVPASLSNVQGDLDIAFYIDSSPSMDSVIADMKKGMKSYLQNLSNSGAQNIRVALYSIDGRMVSDFAPYQQASFDDLLTNSLGHAGGEGAIDYIKDSVSNLSWRPKATRNVVLIADTYLTESYRADQQDKQKLTDFASYVKTNNITLSLMYADDNGFNGPNDNFDYLASQAGVSVYHPKNEQTLVDGLTSSVLNPQNQAVTHHYTYSYDATYLSDGAPSNDITVTVAPNDFTLTSGKRGQFTMTAMVNDAAYLGRRNDTTKVVLRYYIDDVEQPEAAQTLLFRAPSTATKPNLPKTNKPTTPAKKQQAQKTLPQTGETQNSSLTVAGLVLLASLTLVYPAKRRFFN